MQNIIWFDVCAVLVLTALLVVYYTKYNAPFKKYIIFLAMVWCTEISAACSLANTLLAGYVPLWVLKFVNVGYFVSHGMLFPALILYVHSLMDPRLVQRKRLLPWLMPPIFNVMLVLTSVSGKLLFWLDGQGIYHRGPLLILVYAITAYDFVVVIFLLLRGWRIIPRRESVSILISLCLACAGVLVQMLRPEVSVENFSIALCLMISQLTVQNPELIMDGSTGMLNKQGFSNLISPMFEQGVPFQVGFLLVDNYHDLEKLYGFNRLESRMKLLADYLKRYPDCVFARLDTRVFCFVQESSRRSPGWNALLRDLEEDTLIQNLQKEKIGVRFRIKVGVLGCPEAVESFMGLMEYVDMIKKVPLGRNRDVMQLSHGDVMGLQRRKQIENLVRRALVDDNLSVVYQPIYDVEKGQFCGAEALLRMHSDKLGDISPTEFIPVAEENGVILDLTRYVVDTVCSFIRSCSNHGLYMQRIHINLSALDCANENLTDQILESIHRSGLEPDQISAEITETALASLPEKVQENMMDLSDAGVTVMLDDYGIGYSNLSRVYNLPLDVVKLDRSLVQDFLISEPARIVLENTITMMKRLDKKVLVEGVETKEQADFLIENGVSFIQGYYYAHPMDAEHLEALFRAQAEAL